MLGLFFSLSMSSGGHVTSQLQPDLKQESINNNVKASVAGSLDRSWIQQPDQRILDP